MDWSLGETRALALKAARGAGFSWGLAEEAGYAVHWLQRNGAPGVTALADYLLWRCNGNPAMAMTEHAATQLLDLDQNTSTQAASDPHCPLQLGVTVLDHGVTQAPQQLLVRQPLLLIPFLANVAKPQTVRLQWQDTECLVNDKGIQFGSDPGQMLHEQSLCVWRIDNTEPLIHPRQTRTPHSAQQSLSVLEKFAANTYAPATEASRLAGAGAGLNDND